jgi:arginase family enzyme
MLILDFDGSVCPLDGARTIPLREWEESIRFGCRMSDLRRLRSAIEPSNVVFMGSGDFHHVSLLLIERLNSPIQVVVLDNHPDNMRYPFGIHCGSWVWHVSRLPFVARVHVLGITSSDVEGGHVIENHLAPLRSGKVVYWCVRRNLRALGRFGVRNARSFESVSDMLDRFGAEIAETREPVYLSIDKDVLAPDVVQTNWDQGVMTLEELESAIGLVRGRLIASDVVGDVSSYRYRSRFKRLLSGLDRQPQIPPSSLEAMQARHHAVNARLAEMLVRRS